MEINEIVTSNRTKMFGIETRKCRFDTETTSDHGYPQGLYTQNLCLMECGVNWAIKLCGCRPFFYKFGKSKQIVRYNNEKNDLDVIRYNEKNDLDVIELISGLGPLCNVTGMYKNLF